MGENFYKTIYQVFNQEEEITPKIHKAKNSLLLMNWVTKYSPLQGSTKLVAIVIASFYNNKLGYSYPTYSTICSLSGLSESTVNRSIQELKFSGEWLVLKYSKKPGSYSNNVYIPVSPELNNIKDSFMNQLDKEKMLWIPNLKKELLNYDSISYEEFLRRNNYSIFEIDRKGKNE